MGNSAANSASERESRVELDTTELVGSFGASPLDNRVELCRACRGWRRGRSHCVCA